MPDLAARLSAALAEHYQIERELGRGGMATVYLAHDREHDQPVALKVLHPELASAVGPDRFLREIRLTAQLEHPHILPVLDSGEAASPRAAGEAGGGLLWYTMPYVAGESLRQRLTREGQLPIAEALRIARSALTTLGYAHARGVVHRDIKPENILLEAEEVVVADFGLARAIADAGGDRLTESGLAVGTPAYMSPEQATERHRLDGRSDIYSMGCVLYEMLAGEPPYTGPSAQAIVARHLGESPRSLRVVRPTVPVGLQAVVEQALAKVPADRFGSALEFERALERIASGAAIPKRVRARSRRTVLAWSVVLVAVTIAAALLLPRLRPAPALDADLVAIAPFDVLGPGLELWREGVVDVLAHDLDGAGPLRTVSPTTVIRRWTGQADQVSVSELGHRTGARLGIFGTLVGSGADSVKLTATLFDVTAGRPLADMELRDATNRMDRLLDSVTVGFLRELGRTRPIGAVRSAGFGSTSLPALRAFLRGEQFFRRAAWDSALAYYAHAAELDSSFAPALRRMSHVVGWLRTDSDSLGNAYALRAGALNRGLAPRESLLVSADSLFAAVYVLPPNSLGWWSAARRLFATVENVTRRYPDDPDAWYELGEVRFHIGPFIRVTHEQQLGAFDRAIALDSAFAPAYIHPVDLALQLGDVAQARRYVKTYLALQPTDLNAAGMRLAAILLDPERARAPEVDRLLDTASADVLRTGLEALWHWPDAAETGVRVARALARSQHASAGLLADSASWKYFLSSELAYRGHLREAYGVSARSIAVERKAVFLGLALLGGVPTDTARAVFDRWRHVQTPLGDLGLPWWESTTDTSALAEVMARADSAARSAPLENRGIWRYTADAAAAHLALARRDSAEALRRFMALPDSLCVLCRFERLTKVQLLEAAGRVREAATLLDQSYPTLVGAPQPIEVLWALERGRVAERLGNRTTAVSAYQFVADVWQHADSELQRYVGQARDGLRRLSPSRVT